MIARERRVEPATVPLPTPSLPWALTGWGVAVLGVGFAGLLLLIAVVVAPLAVVIWP